MLELLIRFSYIRSEMIDINYVLYCVRFIADIVLQTECF